MPLDDVTPDPLGLDRRAARSAQLARQAASLADDAERYGPLEPGDTQMYRRQAIALRRQAFALRVRATEARRPLPNLPTRLVQRARGTSRMHRARRVVRPGATSRAGPSDEPPLASRLRFGRGASVCLLFGGAA
jgi:hypothetical protein